MWRWYCIFGMRSQHVPNIQLRSLMKLKALNDVINNRYRVVAVFGFCIYILIGLGYYSGHEDLTYLSSIYFSITTILTIGYGDYGPHSHSQRIFTSFYVLFGVVVITAVVGSLGEIFHDENDRRAEARSRKATERMQNITASLSVEEALAEQERQRLDTISRDDSTSDVRERSSTISVSGALDTMRETLSFVSARVMGPSVSNINKYAAESKMLTSMQLLNIQIYDEELQEIWSEVLWFLLMIALIIITGALIMLGLEGWEFWKAWYWAVVTITTVGFGDVTPQTDSGKIFTIFYALVGCSYMARALGELVRYPLVLHSKENELRVMLQFGAHLSEETLTGMLKNEFFDRTPNLRQRSDQISKSEFVLLVLAMMNKVHEKDVLIVSKMFDMMDEGKTGALTVDDLSLEIERARERRRRDSAGHVFGDEELARRREVIPRRHTSSGAASPRPSFKSGPSSTSSPRKSAHKVISKLRGKNRDAQYSSLDSSPMNDPLIGSPHGGVGINLAEASFGVGNVREERLQYTSPELTYSERENASKSERDDDDDDDVY